MTGACGLPLPHQPGTRHRVRALGFAAFGPIALPLALIVGGEAEGATPAARTLADETVSIPMPGQVESLNAGVAGAVLMFEVVRQRKLGE